MWGWIGVTGEDGGCENGGNMQGKHHLNEVKIMD
jgi:hypothetical protein